MPEHSGTIKPYLCPALQDRGAYLRLVKQMHEVGMLAARIVCIALLTQFFVRRLILDARGVNQRFCVPKKYDMGSGVALGQFDIDPKRVVCFLLPVTLTIGFTA